jgi:hypothetical protein
MLFKWGQADVRMKTQYYTVMNKRFPKLRLCELDWKAEQLATEMYSGWRTQWLAKLARPSKRLRSEVSVSNSIHFFRRCISPTYSTLDHLLLWMILLALSLSPPFYLRIQVAIFKSPIPSPSLNQIWPGSATSEFLAWLWVLLLLISVIDIHFQFAVANSSFVVSQIVPPDLQQIMFWFTCLKLCPQIFNRSCFDLRVSNCALRSSTDHVIYVSQIVPESSSIDHVSIYVN